jgi:hypothetical protein
VVGNRERDIRRESGDAMSVATILVIEDQASVRRLLVQVLEDAGDERAGRDHRIDSRLRRREGRSWP